MAERVSLRLLIFLSFPVSLATFGAHVMPRSRRKSFEAIRALALSVFLFLFAGFEAFAQEASGRVINLECMKIRDQYFGKIFLYYSELINRHVYTLEIDKKITVEDQLRISEIFNKVDDYYEREIRWLARTGAPTSECEALIEKLHRAVYDVYRNEVFQLKGMRCE